MKQEGDLPQRLYSAALSSGVNFSLLNILINLDIVIETTLKVDDSRQGKSNF
jgi:hypothetical protein